MIPLLFFVLNSICCVSISAGGGKSSKTLMKAATKMCKHPFFPPFFCLTIGEMNSMETWWCCDGCPGVRGRNCSSLWRSVLSTSALCHDRVSVNHVTKHFPIVYEVLVWIDTTFPRHEPARGKSISEKRRTRQPTSHNTWFLLLFCSFLVPSHTRFKTFKSPFLKMDATLKNTEEKDAFLEVLMQLLSFYTSRA